MQRHHRLTMTTSLEVIRLVSDTCAHHSRIRLIKKVNDLEVFLFYYYIPPAVGCRVTKIFVF